MRRVSVAESDNKREHSNVSPADEVHSQCTQAVKLTLPSLLLSSHMCTLACQSPSRWTSLRSFVFPV